MKDIRSRYDAKGDIDNIIDQFINSIEGMEVFKRYTTTCNVRPKNIYKDNTDIRQRYKDDSLILLCVISYLNTLGFDKEVVIDEISEINEFYPWINNIELIEYNPIKNTFIENIEYLLSESFKNIEQRIYGEFYSPSQLIIEIYNHLDINKNQRVVDPSCGAGLFLYYYIEKLDKLGMLTSEQDIQLLKNNVFGYDIFPLPIIIAKILLGYKISRIFNIYRNIFNFQNVRVQNTLNLLTCRNNLIEEVEEIHFDLIVGNPPYFRIKPDKDNNICNCISFGHNYIHNLFLHWSIQKLRPDSKLCLLLPQSMLSGFYYKRMREELLNECNIDLIVVNNEDIFKVQQEIMVLIATKSNNQRMNYEVSNINNEGRINTRILIPTLLTESDNKVIPIFKRQNDVRVIRRLAENDIVDEFDNIKLSTGNFVWNQNKDIIHADAEEGSIRLICGPNITEQGINLNIDRNGYTYCRSDNPKYIKNETAILYRRMSPIGNAQRMVACIINDNENTDYVVENHVNIITMDNVDRLQELLEFITSDDFNILINSFCQTNQVSTNELSTIFSVIKKLRD